MSLGGADSKITLSLLGASSPLALFETATAGLTNDWSFSQVLPAGTYELRGSASALSSGSFPPDFAVDNNGARFELSFEADPVPLPAAVWLFFSGLGGLRFFARRRVQIHSSAHMA